MPSDTDMHARTLQNTSQNGCIQRSFFRIDSAIYRCPGPKRREHSRRSARRGALTDFRRPEAVDRGAARAHLHAERSHPAHQRDARPRHRPHRGGRERPRADRRPLRGRRHHRRGGRAQRLRALRQHARPGAGSLRLARQRPPVPAAARAAGAFAGQRPAGLSPLARHRALAGVQLLPRRERGRAGIQRRGRGGVRALRLAGRGHGSSTPARTAASSRRGLISRPWSRPRRSGRGSRRARRPPGVAQSRGEAARREPASVRPSDRAAPGDDHLPPRRRAGGLTERASAG